MMLSFLLLGLAQAKSPYALSAPTVLPGLGKTASVGIGDVTGDGLDDLLIASESYIDPVNDLHLYLFVQHEDGSLGAAGAWPIEVGGGALVVADFNEDDLADVYLYEQVFLSDGLGMVRVADTDFTVPYVGFGKKFAAATDMDHDGHVDLVTGQSATYVGNPTPLFVNYGMGDGTFAPPMYVIPGFTDIVQDLEVGDVNADGWTDVVVFAGTAVHVVLNDGAGMLGSEGYELDLPFSWLFTVAVGDVTGDGIADPAVIDLGSMITWDVSSGAVVGPMGLATSGYSLIVADLDGSGRDDCIVVDPPFRVVGVSLGIGPYFQPEATYSIATNSGGPFGLAIGDLDGNGCTDVAVTGTTLGAEVLYGSGCASGLDSDGDGFDDTFDNCVAVANPDQDDSADWDYIGDACDNCLGVENESQDDGDGDGVGSACDLCPAVADPLQEDTDLDGVGDLCDVCPDTADAEQRDVDEDRVGDACDSCPSIADPSQADLDADGSGDLCDGCPAAANPAHTDSDADGTEDACDDCPAVFDRPQSDVDLDGLGDACDPCPTSAPEADADGDGTGDSCDSCPEVPDGGADGDGDGVGDACDLCPLVSDALQADGDADGVGDRCDVCEDVPDAAQENADGDPFGDACDLCPLVYGTSEVDADGDGQGDACDVCPEAWDAGQEDTDEDGFGDACDDCPLVADDAQRDRDGDGLGDACDPCPRLAGDADDGDGDGRGDACDTCPALVDDGTDGDADGVGDACDGCPDDAGEACSTPVVRPAVSEGGCAVAPVGGGWLALAGVFVMAGRRQRPERICS